MIALKIAAAILSLIFALFTAGHGYHAVADQSTADTATAAVFGGLSGGLAWFAGLGAWIQALIAKINVPKPPPVVDPDNPTPPIDPLNPVLPSDLVLEWRQAITALLALFASPRDWVLQKNAAIQLLEAVYVILESTLKDPAILATLTELMKLVETRFVAQAPKTPLGAVKATVAGVPTFAELLEK